MSLKNMILYAPPPNTSWLATSVEVQYRLLLCWMVNQIITGALLFIIYYYLHVLTQYQHLICFIFWLSSIGVNCVTPNLE